MNKIDKDLIDKSLSLRRISKKQLKKISTKKPKKIDLLFQTAHKKEFQKRDCLECANCCKTTSPIFRDTDINRISLHLRIKEQKFIENELFLDSDNDYVLKQSPCSFLNEDNTCNIYSVRPLACREYPHTNRKNMHQIIDLTIKNSTICPGVASIVSKIIK